MQNIHPTAVINDNVIIEEGVYIGPYCIIGFPPEWKGREDDNKGVIIRKGTRITGLVTIDSGAERTTVIGENCYIMKHAYIAHDCLIGDNVTISAGVKIAGYCTVHNGANLGMGVAVHQKVSVPSNVMIGMNGVVTKHSNLISGQKYAGVPVKHIGSNGPKNNS
jgi:UDP-N-acetylglucosamine acyltransferase